MTDDPTWLVPFLDAVASGNDADPVRVGEFSRATVHAAAMQRWVAALANTAGGRPDPVQRAAAEAAHFGRWELPRESRPAGRAGYLEWRRDAAAHQASRVTNIARVCAVPEPDAKRIVALVGKTAGGAAGALHEDALCLTFFELDLADLAPRLDDRQARRAVRRTVEKMSPNGREVLIGLAARNASLGDVLGSVVPELFDGQDVSVGRE